jgi:hypothetical protein
MMTTQLPPPLTWWVKAWLGGSKVTFESPFNLTLSIIFAISTIIKP